MMTDTQAYLQKGRLLAKDGYFNRAKDALAPCKGTKSDAEALDSITAIKTAQSEWILALRAQEAQSWSKCIEHVTGALEVGTSSIELRELRLACEEEAGDVDGVYGDLT